MLYYGLALQISQEVTVRSLVKLQTVGRVTPKPAWNSNNVGAATSVDPSYHRPCGGIGKAVAITGGRNLRQKVHVENFLFFPLDDPAGVLHHFFLERGDRLIPLDLDRARGTGQDAFPAPDAFFGGNDRRRPFFAGGRLGGLEGNGLLRAPTDAEAAAFTGLPFDPGGNIRMLTQLSLPAGASHAQVLQGPSEPGQFMALEVGDADENIRHVDGMGDRNRLEKGSIDPNPDGAIPSQAISDEEGGIDYRVSKSIVMSSGQVGNGLPSCSDIKGIRIGQEGLSLILFHPVHHSP